jgi:hypothetical protein
MADKNHDDNFQNKSKYVLCNYVMYLFVKIEVILLLLCDGRKIDESSVSIFWEEKNKTEHLSF